jgi:chemotaxis signal transduction protein
MESNAWLLKDTNGDYFAVAEVEMVEYSPSVKSFSVPLTPYYCNSIMEWRDQLIPIINLASLFETNNLSDVDRVGVFAYQLKENAVLQYIGIPILDSPIHIVVADSQFSELPTRFISDRIALCLSCFSYQNISVPILNLNYLVSTKFLNTTPKISVTRQDNVNNESGVLK